MTKSQQPANTPQPPAWHQLNYDPPPQARTRTTRQEPQYTSLATDIGHEFRRMGRGIRGIGRDVWTLGVKGTGHDIQRFRLFLQHPPRWFFVALVLMGVIFDICCAISLRNYFTFYHH